MEEMFVAEEIINYTKTLCNLFLEEDIEVDTLMISIDGIAPQAKMVQQRSRRFHSVLQKEDEEIDRLYNVPPKTNVWDTIPSHQVHCLCITCQEMQPRH